MQLNFRKSESTWILCQRELIEAQYTPDVVIIQDPPSSVHGGKNVFAGYRLVRAPNFGPDPGLVAVALHESVRFKTLRPFGHRVVLVEVANFAGPILIVSAYIRHTTGEGLAELEAACRWAKGRCPQVLVGMDGNGHSPWWGPPSTVQNQVGAQLEDFIVTLDFDILNDCMGPATFVSDVGNRTWIDLTLATPSAAASITDWRVDSAFFVGSDHRPIFFSVDSSPLRCDTFTCRDWDRTPWAEFAGSVRQQCKEAGFPLIAEGEIMDPPQLGTLEDQVTRLTEILQEAIQRHVPERRLCWASKPWWSPEVDSARCHMRHMLHRAERLRTDHDWTLYRRARRAFTTLVRKAKAMAWRSFCESINKADMWRHLPACSSPDGDSMQRT